MIKLINDLINFYEGPKDEKETIEKHHLSPDLKANLERFRGGFSGSADLTIRELSIKGTDAAVITIEGMISKDVFASNVLNPIASADISQDLQGMEKYEYIKQNVLSTTDQVEVKTYEEAFKMIMSGFGILALDGCNVMLCIGVQGFFFRSISEPESEVMQKGSREGFVEAIRINMTMIRRRMKNPKLKFEVMTVGSVSQTDICLCYLTDVVSKEILDQIKNRIRGIDIKNVLAAEYISSYLEQKGDLSLFSGVGLSERPDTICGKISEGRVGILIDGTPNALIIPYLFVEYFQTIDDYAIRPYFATFTRWIKYISFFISTLLPGLYVALGTFNPEVFPDQLVDKISSAISSTPLPLLMEVLIIHFIYEVMREAGLRVPKPLGQAVGIVGGLVIGESAVSAGLIGAPTLMVVALTAIASYVIPKLYEPAAVLRFVFIIAGGTLGIFGITLVFAAVIINISAKSNYGVPFLAPISPFSLEGMRDVAIRASWKKLAKKTEKIQNMPGAGTK